MRAALLVPTAVLLAGCIDPSVAGHEPAFEPLHLEGEYWVPIAMGADPTINEFPFPVNATDRRVRVEATISETYAGVQLTGSTAAMTIRLVDASGKAWEESREPLGSMNLAIEATDLPVGNATFVIEVRGGSDGSGNGDHVAWSIDVT